MAAVQETVDSVKALDVTEYKYGFFSQFEMDKAPKGLSEEIVRFISAKKGEPDWMTEWRLEAYRRWLTMEEPVWARVDYPKIDFQDLYYYAAPKSVTGPMSLEDVDPELLTYYKKLGIPLHEQEILAGFQAQTVTVYQTESGRQIFSMNTNPILRASENFALSPNGEEIAVVNNGAIEIYGLPPLNGKDRAGVHLAETLQPERSDGPILMGAKSDAASSRRPLSASQGQASPAVATKAPAAEIVPTTTAPSQTPAGEPDAVPVAQKSTASATTPTQLGDAPAETEGHRKPPTLYAPGETPEPAQTDKQK